MRLLVALGIASVVLAGSYVAATALSWPVRARVGASPPDLNAEPVRIESAKDTVAGWLARGIEGRGAVLLLHGVRANRLSMLARARFLNRAGHTVLLIDLLAHGESSGGQITFGVRESDGVRAALTYLRRVAPGEPIAALGVSLGGASLLLGEGGAAANATDAVILEAVYPTIDEAVANRLAMRAGRAGAALAPLLTWQLRPRLEVGAHELRPIDRIPSLRAPVLVISGSLDRHTTLDETYRLFAAAAAPKKLWIVEGAVHQDLHRYAPEEYQRVVLDFLARHLQPRARASDTEPPPTGASP